MEGIQWVFLQELPVVVGQFRLPDLVQGEDGVGDRFQFLIGCDAKPTLLFIVRGSRRQDLAPFLLILFPDLFHIITGNFRGIADDGSVKVVGRQVAVGVESQVPFPGVKRILHIVRGLFHQPVPGQDVGLVPADVLHILQDFCLRWDRPVRPGAPGKGQGNDRDQRQISFFHGHSLLSIPSL